MITSSSPQSKRGRGWCPGFTLVEMMVAVVLTGILSAMVMPTLIFFSKSMYSVGNYAKMGADSRTALEVLSRDLHVAASLNVASPTSMTVTLPSELDSAEVVYSYNASTQQLTRAATISGSTVTRMLFGDVDSFEFIYYNRLGVDVSASASILSQTKSVQINAKLLKEVAQIANTDYIISARFLMRNM